MSETTPRPEAHVVERYYLLNGRFTNGAGGAYVLYSDFAALSSEFEQAVGFIEAFRERAEAVAALRADLKQATGLIEAFRERAERLEAEVARLTKDRPA